LILVKKSRKYFISIILTNKEKNFKDMKTKAAVLIALFAVQDSFQIK
jgi:hypothetical protein